MNKRIKKKNKYKKIVRRTVRDICEEIQKDLIKKCEHDILYGTGQNEKKPIGLFH